MKHAETVTFGGSALDRAGEVRADKEAVAALRADDAARAILFWRGKVLIDPARPASVVRLPLDHPVLADAGSAPILLGREEGAARFAYDLSPWMPDDFDPRQLGSFVDQSEQRHPMLPPDYALATQLPRVPRVAFSAHRSGCDHADYPRQLCPDGAVAGLARGDVLAFGGVCRTG